MNAIPIVGWFFSFVFNVSLALPFWLVWTVFGIGEKYGYFLPEVYRTPGFWACVGVFIAVEIIEGVFVPKFVSVSNSQKVRGPKVKPKEED